MAKNTRSLIVKKVAGVSVVRFMNKKLIDPQDVEVFSTHLHDLIEKGAQRLVLDFKHVEFVCSSTLSMLLSLSKQLVKSRGALAIVHSTRLLDLLKISRTYSLFKIADSSRSAIKLLNAVKS